MAGLLDDPKTAALLNFGLGMLESSGPSMMPTSIGQAIGRAGKGAMSVYQEGMENQHKRSLQEIQMLQAKSALAESMRKAQRLAQIEASIKDMPQDVQQAYMFGGPEKVLEYMQQKQFMQGADGLINPKSVPERPVRPYNPDGVSSAEGDVGNFQMTPGLASSVEKLKQTNPAEYQNVVKALQEQGLIKTPTPAPDYGRLAEYAARGQLAGIKGASGLMELAKFNKPDIQYISDGQSMIPVNKNGMPGPIQLKPSLEQQYRESADKRDFEYKRQQDALARSEKYSPMQASEDERKAAGWLNQATKAWENMKAVAFDELGKIKTGVAVPSLGESLPLPGAIKNSMLSPDRQKFNQAASSLSEALLRAATGAGVNAYEAEQKIAELTPKFGDSEDVIIQKFEAVPMYLESLKARSGRATANVPAQQKPTAEQPKAPKEKQKSFKMLPPASEYKGARMRADNGTIYRSDGSKWVKQ